MLYIVAPRRNMSANACKDTTFKWTAGNFLFNLVILIFLSNFRWVLVFMEPLLCRILGSNFMGPNVWQTKDQRNVFRGLSFGSKQHTLLYLHFNTHIRVNQSASMERNTNCIKVRSNKSGFSACASDAICHEIIYAGAEVPLLFELSNV